MTNESYEIRVPIKAEFGEFTNALKDLQIQSVKFSTNFSSAIRSAIVNGKSFEETLSSLATRLSDMALTAGLKPLEKLVATAVNSVFQSSSFGASNAGEGIVPFAKGGGCFKPILFLVWAAKRGHG